MDSKLRKVLAEVSTISRQQGIGLRHGVATHQEVRHQVLSPPDLLPAPRAFRLKTLPAMGAQHLVVSIAGIRCPGLGGLPKGILGEWLRLDAQVIKE
ncbi:MAG: hypothetical protein M0Z27_11060 [Thermaerobacter sp.]|nr:hypothetical protein [Thermaerobacter sp.]